MYGLLLKLKTTCKHSIITYQVNYAFLYWHESPSVFPEANPVTKVQMEAMHWKVFPETPMPIGYGEREGKSLQKLYY